MRPLVLVVLLLLGGSCRTESVSSTPIHETEIAYADTQTMWEVHDEGGLLGYVVSFSESRDGGRTFFSVRNPSHQELGLIDGHGRIYRYHAHEREPEWLGTGTVSEGARRILDGGERTRLVERLGADPAAAPTDSPVD